MSQTQETERDPKIQAIIDKYYPCDPVNELKAAAKVAVELGYISTATLQVGFSLGYIKARKMIDELEKLGVIGPQIKQADGSFKRDVLVALNDIDVIFKDYKPAGMEEVAKSVTIMKYQGDDDQYYFVVKDKFDIVDSVERLDYMNDLRDEMLASGKMKKHLWTKETVLF